MRMPRRPFFRLYADLSVAIACCACAGSPPPDVAAPARAPVEAPLSPPEAAASAPVLSALPESPPPAPTPPQPPAEAPPDPTGCVHARCDARELRRCASTDDNRIAAIDELEQCGRERVRQRDEYRHVMVQLGFRNGVMPRALGERLVRARLLTPQQAKWLDPPGIEIRRILAARVNGVGQAYVPPGAPPSFVSYRLLSIAGNDCVLDGGPVPGTIELRCSIRGSCSGACRRGGAHATFRVEVSGLRLIEAKDDFVEDMSCGACE